MPADAVVIRQAAAADAPELYAVSVAAIEVSAATHYTQSERNAWSGSVRSLDTPR